MTLLDDLLEAEAPRRALLDRLLEAEAPRRAIVDRLLEVQAGQLEQLDRLLERRQRCSCGGGGGGGSSPVAVPAMNAPITAPAAPPTTIASSTSVAPGLRRCSV